MMETFAASIPSLIQLQFDLIISVLSFSMPFLRLVFTSDGVGVADIRELLTSDKRKS